MFSFYIRLSLLNIITSVIIMHALEPGLVIFFYNTFIIKEPFLSCIV